MTNTIMGSLREAQKLDERIREIRQALMAFDDRLAEVEEPALKLESELAKLTERLAQMNTDARRLERSADDKRARAEKLDQRLNRVSNLREEAAVHTERDLIKRAIESDEQEALQLLDQIHRSEMVRQELDESVRKARAEVVPQQEALLVKRETFQDWRKTFEGRRLKILGHVGDAERRLYDAFHQSGRPVIVAALLEDGACGNCFGVIPLQLQNEIRVSGGLIRCENCGVILTTEPEPILDSEVESPIELPDIRSDEDEPDGELGDEEAAADEVSSTEASDEQTDPEGPGDEKPEAEPE